MPLEITPVSPPAFMAIPFTYEISVGVRKGDDQLRAELDRCSSKNAARFSELLSEYGVPQVP